eukprot:13254927-Ditylum_brightwellii.AAC.1
MENNNIHNCENNDFNALQNVRQRANTELRPLNDTLMGSSIMTQTEPVSLHVLMDKTREHIP